MIISPAYAQVSSFISPELMNFAPIILIFLLMYVLILRPQNKKAKQHRDMLANLRRGDRVLTAGGIIGTISKIENDQEVQIEIAENVRVRVAKATLTQVLVKTEPVNTETVPQSKSIPEVKRLSDVKNNKKTPAKKSSGTGKNKKA